MFALLVKDYGNTFDYKKSTTNQNEVERSSFIPDSLSPDFKVFPNPFNEKIAT